jgi:uncharacterized CHY-type Zn-finger protein
MEYVMTVEKRCLKLKIKNNMIIYGKCKKCNKYGFFIRKRQYTVPKVSSKPITTADEMCGKCAKSLAKIIKKA